MSSSQDGFDGLDDLVTTFAEAEDIVGMCPSDAYGVGLEIGMVATEIQACAGAIECNVHAFNRPRIASILRLVGRAFVFSDGHDEWLKLTIKARKP